MFGLGEIEASNIMAGVGAESGDERLIRPQRALCPTDIEQTKCFLGITVSFDCPAV